MNETSTSPVAAGPGRADGSAAMFDRIARRYDLLNRILSFGRDRSWRRRAVRALGVGAGGRVLDLATGTADLAIEISRSYPDCEVVGLDPSTAMLDRGEEKVAEQGLAERVTLRRGEAQRLPFDDGSFDAVAIAFGIRNVVDRPAGLREMARVVRPGGRVVILELTEPRGGLLGAAARLHVKAVVPRIGALLSGEPEYRYLQRSIAAFPPPSEFCDLMTEAGLELVECRPLTFGACHLFVGRRPLGEPSEGSS